MKEQILVTAAGSDRPGIVARLTEEFVRHGANLEESRMALLGGEFAAVILVSVESSRFDDLIAGLSQLKQDGISITTKKTSPLDAARFSAYVSCDLTVKGADHEGIVHRIAAYLRDQAVNIETMDSEVISAPETGTPLFCMRALIKVPPSISFVDFEKSLMAVGDEESVEVVLYRQKDQLIAPVVR